MCFSKLTFEFSVGPNYNEIFRLLLSLCATVAHFTSLPVPFLLLLLNSLPQLPVIGLKVGTIQKSVLTLQTNQTWFSLIRTETTILYPVCVFVHHMRSHYNTQHALKTINCCLNFRDATTHFHSNKLSRVSMHRLCYVNIKFSYGRKKQTFQCNLFGFHWD